MDESTTVTSLIELGLNEREARLYVALLRTSEATPAMLHRISGVPRTKTYETLDRMVAGGLCSERVEGRTRYFRATRPAEVCEKLRQDWKVRLQRRCQVADETFENLDDLFQASSATDPALERIEVIRSKEQINRRWRQLLAECHGEVLSFTRSPYAASDETTRAEVKRVQREAFARGVVIKTVYMVEDKQEIWLRSFVAELERAGEQVRLSDDLPVKMFIFDRRVVLIALPSIPGLTGADFSMLAVEDPGFTRACLRLFETYWEEAVTSGQWARRAAAEG